MKIVLAMLAVMLTGGCSTFEAYQDQDKQKCHYKVSSKRVNYVCPFN